MLQMRQGSQRFVEAFPPIQGSVALSTYYSSREVENRSCLYLR